MTDIRSFSHRLASFRGVFLRAVIFGVAWYFLSAWLFIPVALYLYFVPYFHAGKFLPSFLAILILYFLAPATLSYVVIGFLAFGCLMSIRGLLFIDRRAAYEILAIILSFFLLRTFYMSATMMGGVSLVGSFCIAVVIGWILQGLIRNFMHAPDQAADPSGQGHVPENHYINVVVWLSIWLIWQAMVIGLVLPLDFVYQSVIVFLFTIMIIDLVSAYLWGDISSRKILLTTSIVFGGLVLVMASAPLGL